MIAYVECPAGFGQGIHRVVRELKAHAPAEVTFTQNRDAADLIVHHVVGVQNFSQLDLPSLIAQDKKPYAVIQYCLRTTERSDTGWWFNKVWEHADVVWSYYDLRAAMAHDHPALGSGVRDTLWGFQFYHAPLGVSDDFYPRYVSKHYLVGTSGYVADTEGIDAWAAVVRHELQMQFHLGPQLPCFEPNVTCRNGISDVELATMWSACQYVNGLRAVEGFELPAAEGLVCGARPVLYDRPDHRQWFGLHAEYINESLPLTLQLMELVQARQRVVSADEIAWARGRFDWLPIVRGFWNRII